MYELDKLQIQFVGMNQVQNNRKNLINQSTKILNKNLKILKQNENDSNFQCYKVGHHCKMLFRDEYLISYNYRSGTMRLAIINKIIMDSYLLSQSIHSNKLIK
ncbi:unnamed protein product [Paramecium sonneborni]|uniref:Uncharacterized protein n=1 Tax=Paramecium sonneborni TaxID=65129 RepID=A0A8S1K5N0_9CILI|nr:unnamed protein product [Paramecium sonneborni]